MCKSCVLMIGLMLCVILSACQSPRPQATAMPTILPTVPPLPVEAARCALRPDAAWRTWRAGSQPAAVYALLPESGAVWAGTAAGVFRIDPRTGIAMQTLDYATLGGVRKLFPLDNGRVWADTARGPFYFDGQEWTPLEITGAVGSPGILAVDLNGDVLMETFVSRSYIRYRLPGHVPPPRYRPWEATREPISSGWVDPAECQFQTYISGNFSYHSQAECRALNRARQMVREKIGQGIYVTLDADGSAWWATVPSPAPLPGRPTGSSTSPPSGTLGHLSKTVSTTLQLPGTYINWIAPDPAHGVWLGTNKGLAYSDGQDLRWVSLGLGACTIPDNPYSLVVDPQGTAWVVTVGGVRALSPNESEWQHVPDPSQTESEIRSIAPTDGGGIWATHEYDLFRLGGEAPPTPVPPPDPKCFLLRLTAGAGSVWSASLNCGFLQFNVSSASWARHNLGASYSEPVTFGADGTVYVLESGDLYAYAGTSSVGASGEQELEWRLVAARNVDLMAADKQGGVWIASRNDGLLWYYKNGQVTQLGQQFDARALQQLTVDSRNRLWGAAGSVLSVYDGKSWLSTGTPMRQIRELTSGPDGRIWIVGEIGIAVYDPAADKLP